MLIHTGINLSPLEQLLTQGGDARIALDNEGYNKYGCGIVPDSIALAYGSATASTISAMARSAASEVYQQLESAHDQASLYVLVENEFERARQELRQLCGLTGDKADAALAETDIVFAASGTDLHLIAAQLLALPGKQDTPMLIIMVEPGETGSSVPAALSGHHFSQRTALGVTVSAGDKMLGARPTELGSIAIRDVQGRARNATEVDAEIKALVDTAISQQKQVMLVLADVSKTGMLAPSINLALGLQQQYPTQFKVLVDACQFRLSNASVHGYLRQGCMVAVTGSKFVSGPSFSGALLIPQRIASELRQLPLPQALQAYCSRADWPSHWPGAAHLHKHANIGLLLRWVAALAELRAFRQLPDAAISDFVLQFGQAVQAYFQHQRILTLLPSSIPDRSAPKTGTTWDQLPTIFSFLLNDASGQQLLRREQTMQVYKRLQKEQHIQLGQPVAYGAHQQKPVSALRLCLSARLIVAATAYPATNADKIIDEALQVLDRTAELVSSLA
ncbi:hypothetical protein ACO0LF_25400 [Undibacterium sp. Di27W]|uniref:hypothetical protein n=1 Tax=Undibacterium sp. Di27W TaxID=3413036 RepID=UPI003BF3026D